MNHPRIELGDFIGLNGYSAARVDKKQGGLITLETGQEFRVKDYGTQVWSHYRWSEEKEDYESIEKWNSDKFVRMGQ